ncbi:MAG: hypothetical protein WAN86_16515 [Hyphomicrobiaceae bacterium]
MLRSIDLDYQFGRMIAKIRDARADRRLLAEAETAPVELAQMVPELAFRRLLLTPQSTCTFAHQIGHG